MSSVTTLTKAVKFRSLADQLTDSEFTTFIKDTIWEYDRSVILTPIFNQYSQHNAIPPDPQVLDELITIIKDIMNRRNPGNKSGIDADPKPVTMLSLSSSLIGEIGSLLDQKSHMRFSRCSRDLHIGCESPCTLRSLSLLGTDSYERVNLQRYAQIGSLRLDVNLFQHLPLPSRGIVCRSLSTLTLRNGDVRHNPDLNSLLQCSAIDFTNITALTLQNFFGRQRNQTAHRFPVESFLNLLSIFPNLQFLYLNGLATNPLNSEQLKRMKKMLPNLHSLREGSTVHATTTGILSAFCDSLRSLTSHTWRIPHHPVGHWSLMEEVQLVADGGIQPLMREIINSSPRLKRVRLQTEKAESPTVKGVITDIIVRAGRLEQLTLDIKWSRMSLICGAIDRALFDIVERKRKRLFIALTVRWDEQAKSADLVYELFRVLNQLANSQIENFFFWCHTWSKASEQQFLPDPAQWKEQLRKFKGQQGNRFDIAVKKQNTGILMTTPNFQWDGSPWIYPKQWPV